MKYMKEEWEEKNNVSVLMHLSEDYYCSSIAAWRIGIVDY